MFHTNFRPNPRFCLVSRAEWGLTFGKIFKRVFSKGEGGGKKLLLLIHVYDNIGCNSWKSGKSFLKFHFTRILAVLYVSYEFMNLSALMNLIAYQGRTFFFKIFLSETIYGGLS